MTLRGLFLAAARAVYRWATEPDPLVLLEGRKLEMRAEREYAERRARMTPRERRIEDMKNTE